MAESGHASGLLGVDAAIARLVGIARQQLPETEEVGLSHAPGRVLALDVRAGMNVPPEANSAMDGIAFCHADLSSAAELGISQRIPAGHVPAALQKNTAARIFTGAILPAGADTVAMQENCEFFAESVRLKAVPECGANVRQAGQDVHRDAVILQTGTRLNAPALGLLASTGMDVVSVYKRLRVAVLATGDELLEPGEPWRSGSIYNSNRPMLSALLSGWGCEVIDLGRVADTQEATIAALCGALAEKVDVIISSGGVSVGEEDHVRAALQSQGRLDFWKIAIKPGKPVAVGDIDGVAFLGLPGNPQSVFITALLLARPFLLARQGQTSVLPAAFAVPAGFSRSKKADRREYVRVQMQSSASGPELHPHPQQSSGALLSAVWADGLALLETGSVLEAGQIIPFLPFSTLYQP